MIVRGIDPLLISLCLFSLALALHVVVWRISPPRRYLFWFLKYWALLPLAAVGACLGLYRSLHGALPSEEIVLVWLGGLLTYSALCACFVLVYPAISMSSLSLEILRFLHRHGPQPAGSFRLSAQSGEAMLATRRTNLLESGMFEENGRVLTLTLKGRAVASVINAIRWTLAIPKGSGG